MPVTAGVCNIFPMVNPSFEDTTDFHTGWIDDGHSVLETTNVYNGSQAVALTISATGEYRRLQQQIHFPEGYVIIMNKTNA